MKPPACAAGSEEAQSAAAFWNFVSKGLTLLFNPVLGSVSDQGRRPILLSGLFLSCLPATVFVLFIKIPSLHPFWFNVSSCLIGIVDIISIMFACLSDIFPVRFRAAGFGLLMSAFYGGFAFAPSLTLLLDAEQLAVTSLVLIMASLVTAFLFMPETLSDEMRLANEVQRFEQSAQHETNGWFDSSVYVIKRPLREMSILRRSRSLQLVTVVSFLSAMVFASDATLLLYYVQERLDVQPQDFAAMFLLMGVVGIIVQAGLLQPLSKIMGEHALLVASCLCGSIHNLVRFFGWI